MTAKEAMSSLNNDTFDYTLRHWRASLTPGEVCWAVGPGTGPIMLVWIHSGEPYATLSNVLGECCLVKLVDLYPTSIHAFNAMQAKKTT